MRDRLKDAAYWVRAEQYRKDRIASFQEAMVNRKNTERYNKNMRLRILNNKFELFWAAFSKGAPLEQCREMYLDCLRSSADLWEWKTNYNDLLWYTSLGVLFRVDQQDAAILEQIALTTGSADQLICSLLRAVKPDHCVPAVDEVPPPYHIAASVFSMERQQAEAVLTDYLKKQWYRGQRHEAWYNDHKWDDNLYLGYWSFETAALVRILGLNDEKLKKSPYYPPELADYQ